MQSVTVTISDKGLDKKIPLADTQAYARQQFHQEALPPYQLAVRVAELGHAFYGATFDLNGDESDGFGIGRSNSHRSTTLVALDFDNKCNTDCISIDEALSICEESDILPLFSYKTFSYTDEHQCFRLVWATAITFAPKRYYNEMLKDLNELLFYGKADKFAISAIKRWQGSRHGIHSFNEQGVI